MLFKKYNLHAIYMKSFFQNYSSLSLVIFIATFSLVLATSCKQSHTDEPATAEAQSGTGDLAGLTLEDIPGSSTQYATKVNAAGLLETEGFVKNGQRVGQWIQYTPEGDISQIDNYVDGMLEGTSLRMSFRNQVDMKSSYKRNMLNGPWYTYKYGKITEQRNYKNNKLDGLVRTFNDRTFKIQQEVQYKDGVQHGYFKYYDEEGNVTLEYMYENGEKVSGGIVEQK